MSRVFFIQYEVRPVAHSEHAVSVGGAFANCFVVADAPEVAARAALRNFVEGGWEVVEVIEPAFVPDRSDLDEAWLDWYDEAARRGECYVFHQWPNEPQEGEPLH